MEELGKGRTTRGEAMWDDEEEKICTGRVIYHSLTIHLLTYPPSHMANIGYTYTLVPIFLPSGVICLTTQGFTWERICWNLKASIPTWIVSTKLNFCLSLNNILNEALPPLRSHMPSVLSGVIPLPYLTPRGLSSDSPKSLHASLANMSATSVQCQGSRRSA